MLFFISLIFVLYMLFFISWLYCIIPIKATIKD